MSAEFGVFSTNEPLYTLFNGIEEVYSCNSIDFMVWLRDNKREFQPEADWNVAYNPTGELLK
jgi:hypothetical protein